MAPARSRRVPSPDRPKAGDRARDQLLEAAGEVFAEKGYAQATSREICERAGVNAAAVNYHFGGFDMLHTETLARAHRRIVTLEALRDIAVSEVSPRQKLRTYIALIVSRLALPAASWEMRLLSREIISPSPGHEAFIMTEILPKSVMLRGILAAFLGTTPDHPAVGRSMLTVIAPSLMLAVADRTTLTSIMPELLAEPNDISLLIDHLECFVCAGLDAIATQLRAEETSPDSSASNARKRR